MSYRVTKNEHVIDLDTRSLISMRYKRITKVVNQTFWNSISDTAHSFYAGSYGRGTAINTSDLDVLIELPDAEYNHFSDISITMNVYTHIGFDDAEEELKRMKEFRKAQAEVE